ncbi:MAG: isoleucine--tRNA ligase [Gammaproteobacteria bacterium]|nr:isoleucine--tRNA ligase [Gammaproteobacteria bacterium]NIM71869.1 isoleucine--tRNA ligase [Gammaproteobacteria bacterium]NIN37991.1 isoleucine--tRNA ligase [Gammaproteobacteria bacterium]NIO23625.1 isoleucine--tRNA ligase [Gammaproteobacteria bacterium]NIO64241.1 isoleucine--tRNA ligase [Gammaproteobacteria bacterium]
MSFEEVGGRYDGPALEQQVLAFWRDQDVFAKSMQQSEGRPLYTWNEGPPTANGKPGIHHVLARTFKDMFPRFKHMRGFHCPRKAGWDTHGLPVEHEIEKELGIFDKSRIEEEVGIAEFTRRCRESVMRYIGDWEAMTERMGFWVNMDDAYYTLENDYIESVWWLLKVIWDKGLIYQGYKVVPYDPRIGATLSSHEVALGYKEVDDPSVTVRFRLEDDAAASFLVWTTTPWTLPSNMALAVHPDLDYAWVESGGETLILAQDLLESVLHDTPYKTIKVVKGAELVGLRYQRLFDYLPAEGDICRVHAADFVTTEDGTGIVHIAPAYGVDDLALGQKHGLPVVHGVGLDGYFLPQVAPVAGRFFKEADPVLIELLRERGLLYRAESYRHNYPHGWRTGDPLLYYAKNAWYIRTTDFRDRMVALNKTINWVPESIRDGRFGNWLEHNVDWALSRERFWGTPLPVWTDGEGDFVCIGSLAELEKLTGESLRDLDLHRPAVDEVTFVHPDNGRTYRRVPEVIDCWFDSGAMSYAQWHYPFENKALFEERFPADYICEAIDQTRGWFYTLHAIATLVSDSVAFRNCVCLAHIVDKDGKKMSKSLGNIVDPYDVFDTVGADALRWYLAARIAPEVQKRISVELVREVASTFINTLWNTYGFFVLYARLDAVDLSKDVALEKRPEIDRWILALLHHTTDTVTEAMERYDARAAGEAIESFVDQLSNWYVRRNRRRFWKAAAGEDKQAAYLTLFECLHVVHRLMAPLMPFLSEAMYQNLVRAVDAGAPMSVHMADWPVADAAKRNRALIEQFDVVQRVVGLGRAARNDTRLRVRQPLARLLVRVPDEAAAAAVQAHREQILEELNVKSLELVAADAALVSYRLKPNLPRIGKRYGKRIPAIRAALAEADAARIASSATAGQGFELDVDGETIAFEAEDVLVESVAAEGYACAEEGGYLVGLDTRLDDALLEEGLARELVRTIQEARKQAGLEVSDRIVLRVTGSDAVEAAVATHRDFLMDETLASSWGEDGFDPSYATEHSLDDNRWKIELKRAA